MLPKALNQITVPGLPVAEVLALARDLQCSGVELRNDLGRPLFDGLSPTEIRDMAASAGLGILAVAEVKSFNLAPDPAATRALIAAAAAAGARGVALIPHVGTSPIDRDAQCHALRTALPAIMPLLQDHGLIGLIEPLGFAVSSLRFKADVATVLDELGQPACFRIVHDTFHHHLASEAEFFPSLTGIVHVSGVTDPDVGVDPMQDAHRVLVDDADRLGNIAQLRALTAGGYRGAVSLECFAPDVHRMTDPATAVAGSFAFIASQLAAEAA